MATDVSAAAPVSLNFARGDGRLSPSLPAAGVGPLAIRLAPDVLPEDVSIVLDTEALGYPTTSSTVNLVQVRITSTGDVLSFPITGQQDPATVSAQLRLEFADGSIWQGPDLLKQLALVSQVTSNYLGTAEADAITGDGRNLALYGLGGDDTITSSAGNETLVGGAGRNQYVLNVGWGQDRIVSDWSQDTVSFGPGITTAMVKATPWGSEGDVRLSFANSSDSVILAGLGKQGAALGTSQGFLQFADGSLIGYLDLFNFVFPSGSVPPAAQANLLTSTEQSDVYVLQPGNGNDTIGSFISGVPGKANDLIRLGTSDVSLAFFTQDKSSTAYHSNVQNIEQGLEITFNATGEKVRVYDARAVSDRLFYTTVVYDNRFLKSDQVVLELADGRGLTGRDLAVLLVGPSAGQPVLGGNMDDVLRGGSGNDTIDGGAGDDTIVLSDFAGAFGQDVVLHQRGGGRDTVVARQDGGYTLRMGAGISVADVYLTDSLLNGGTRGLAISGTADQIIGLPTRVEFADGTVLDQAAVAGFTSTGQGKQHTYVGTQADDIIWGRASDDIIRGGAGSDRLSGFDGNDAIYGGEGVDNLVGGDGNNTLNGGTGNDNISAQATDIVEYNLGDGLDFITTFFDGYTLRLGEGITPASISISTLGLSEPTATEPRQFTYGSIFVNGTEAIKGGAPAKVVFADGTVWGADQIVLATLKGTALDDSMRGGTGNDLLQGGEGKDTIDGGAGNDTLDGGAGNDSLVAGLGRDVISFGRGDGRDTLTVGDTDTLQFKAGVASTDIILRKAADGTLHADLAESLSDGIEINSTDKLAGLSIKWADGTTLTGATALSRAAANLYLDGSTGTGPTVQGGAGDDWIIAQRSSDQAPVTAAFGGKGRDVLIGVSARQLLDGGDGNDILQASVGSSTLVGGAGADQFMLGLVNGTVIQADGLDVVRYGEAYDAKALRVVRQGSVAEDRVVVSNGGYTNFVLDRFSQLDALRVQFADGTVLTGAQLKPLLVDQSPTPYGTVANDQILGTSSYDYITGDLGNDFIDGGAGADEFNFNAGDGQDTIHADSTDTLVFAIDGLTLDGLQVDRIDPAKPTQVVIRIKGSTDSVTIDNLTEASGLTVRLPGVFPSLTGAQILALANKPASLTLTGTAKADTLTGKDGDDTLSGLAGNDTLAGGKGNDSLVGGKGNDTYLFNRGDGQDVVNDTDSTLFNSDLLKLGGATSKQLWLTKAGNNLDIKILGTSDKVTVQNWFASSSNRVEKITASDGKSLSASKVQALVSAMASFTPPADAASLPANAPAALIKLVASSWV